MEQLIRLENLAARATRRLGMKPNCEQRPPSLSEHLARKAQERTKQRRG
jgi:hypothetical protein